MGDVRGVFVHLHYLNRRISEYFRPPTRSLLEEITVLNEQLDRHFVCRIALLQQKVRYNM